MQRAPSILILVLLSLVIGCSDAISAQTSQTVQSPDRELRVVITPAGREQNESRVQIEKINGEVLCTEDLASIDAERGLGVTEGRWTPDSRFFVYSTSSSGGHQPYHAPTFFFSRRSNRVRNIEELTHLLVVDQAPKPTFKIIAPDTVVLVTSDNGLENEKATFVDLRTEGFATAAGGMPLKPKSQLPLKPKSQLQLSR